MRDEQLRIVSLLKLEYKNVAKLTKYVEKEVKNLKRIVKLRNKGLVKDEIVLYHHVNEIKKLEIGTDFIEKVRVVNRNILELNQVANSVILRTIEVRRSTTSSNDVAKIDIELRMIVKKVLELIQLFNEESSIKSGLSAIQQTARLHGYRYISDYIKKASEDLGIRFQKQDTEALRRAISYMEKTEIRESNVRLNASVVGRLYRGPKPNGKVVIIYGGTTLHHKQYEPLSYRFALEGYDAFAMNLPAHGNDLNFRLGNGAGLLRVAVRYFRKNGWKQVGAIGFSFGALSMLYNVLNFDFRTEKDFSDKMGNFVTAVKKGDVTSMQSAYDQLKITLLDGIKRVAGAEIREISKRQTHTVSNEFNQQQVKTSEFSNRGLVPTRDRGIPDAMIFCGMPVSLFRSKKLVCPGAVSITYGWMQFVTNNFFNNPPQFLQKFINGLDRHNPIEELDYSDKTAIYMKHFKIKDKNEFHKLKAYLKELSHDPDNIIPLVMANAGGQFMNYYLNRVREIPKLFMYGKKDAIAGGSFFKELFRRLSGKNQEIAKVQAIIEAVGSVEQPRLYANIGHTLDERAGFLKKLSRRPQGVDIQNDMVTFIKKYI